MKARLRSAEAEESQHSADAPLERLQRGVEHRIENLVQRPVVVRRDDQMPARLQDTEDLSQRLRQRYEPLGYANQHDEVEPRIRKWHIVDVAHLREHA